MFFWKDVLAQQEHFADLNREAERNRLARQALDQNGQPARGGRHILNALRNLFGTHDYPPVVNTPLDPDACEQPVLLERLKQSQERVTGCSG